MDNGKTTDLERTQRTDEYCETQQPSTTPDDLRSDGVKVCRQETFPVRRGEEKMMITLVDFINNIATNNFQDN